MVIPNTEERMEPIEGGRLEQLIAKARDNFEPELLSICCELKARREMDDEPAPADDAAKARIAELETKCAQLMEANSGLEDRLVAVGKELDEARAAAAPEPSTETPSSGNSGAPAAGGKEKPAAKKGGAK